MTKEEYMREAINEGMLAKEAGEWPFGAVIVKDGKIIARGECNEKRTKSVLGHAELQAINTACNALGSNNLSGCTIYCTNEPCLMCSSAIIQAKIGTVIYSLKRDDLSHILRKRHLNIVDLITDSGYAISVKSGVLKEETLQMFEGVKK